MAPASADDEAEVREQCAPTAPARLAIGAVSIAALLLGLAGYLADADRLRTGELLVFCLLGLGAAPCQLAPALRLPERTALSFLCGWLLLTGGTLAMSGLDFWHPAGVFVVVAAVALHVHLIGLYLAVRDLRTARGDADGLPSGRGWATALTSHLPIVLAVAGAGLSLAAALATQHLVPGIWGFLPHIGPLWYAGLALVGAGFVCARPSGPERGYAVPVLLLVLVLTLTPAIVYDGPRSQSAVKHVDLVMQIRTLHETRSSVGVYNGWDGYFSAVAWLCDIAGISDPLRLATFWPPLLAVFRLAALRWLFGRLLPTTYAAWAAVALAVLADPVGADYFSPQSVGFVVAILVFAAALDERLGPWRVPILVAAGVLLAVTHQLSPYIAGGVLCLLVLFRQLRPWWLPATVLAPAIAWALMHRDQLSGFVSLADVGRLQNFRPPETVGGAGLALDRLPVVGDTVRALLLGVLVLGLLAAAAVLRRPRDRQGWALACCPSVALVLIAVNPYGQEGVFRAIIFGLPWLAVLAVRFLLTATPAVFRAAVGGLAGLLASTFLIASFGLDASNVVRPADVAALEVFLGEARRAPLSTPALLVLGVGDLPTAPPPAGATYRIVAREDLRLPVGQQPSLRQPALVEAITLRLLRLTQQDPRRAALFAVWSPVSDYYGVQYGLQRPGDFPALRDALTASGYWRPVFERNGTVLFRFDPPAFSGRQG